MSDYEWEIQEKNRTPKSKLSSWKSKFGPIVIERNEDKTAKIVKFQILIDNPHIEIYLVCKYNDWGKNLENLEELKFKKDKHGTYATLETDKIKHKDEYKFLVKDKNNLIFREDPAAVYFTDEGNSVFWDYEDPSSYKSQHDLINTFDRPTIILQTDLPGLIVHHKHEKTNKYGHEINEKEFYKFIAKSGIIKKIKELGFNTIQFLPFAQNIDGSNWKYRYLVPFQFAIQKNWGNPDDFKEMIDEFHKEGISVIGDFVLGHIPHKDYKIFGKSSKEHGLHTWQRHDGWMTYLKEETSWGTMRIDFDNEHVREFFISSCIHFMKEYKIDGFRIDNVDGIIRYGPNGDEDERPNGRTFLRELNQTIYNHNPYALINYEAHYYYEDNAKLLVSPINSNHRALGATAYNSSRITYYFHTELMFKTSDEITMWKFKHINDEKEWGKSNSTVADFHNHDAAAGLMSMRCTGSYAIDSMEHNGTPRDHSIGKIKTMEGIISFALECRTLNLLQTFLIQEGTFEHDSSIQWNLLENKDSKTLVEFKKNINLILQSSEAFHPINIKNRQFLNVDDQNKILVIERKSKSDKFVILINGSSNSYYKYKVGLTDSSNYKIIYNSNSNEKDQTLENKSSKNFEVLEREIELDIIGPYEVIILKKE